MRLRRAMVVVAALLFAVPRPVRAESISLAYAISGSPTNGKYDYAFRLTLDNTNGNFKPGQGWGWIVFGDVPAGASSPIGDFALTGLSPNNPFTGAGVTGGGIGGHNGPTLLPINFALPVADRVWFPTAVGQSIGWSGTSANRVVSGLRFSTIYNEAGATKADFDLATYTGTALPPAVVPFPTAAVGGAGLLGGIAACAGLRRRGLSRRGLPAAA